MLGQVREDDDGDESFNSSEGDTNYSASQARRIEQLARENALLRQAAAAGQTDNRYRERAGSAASLGGGVHSLHRIRGGVPEEDLAVEDPGELRDISGYNIHGNTRRRFSEHSPHPEPPFSSFAPPLENRALENVRKAHWQTSLGFGRMADMPQSRRHSFADIPMRHGSVGSVDSLNSAAPRAAMGDREDGYGINDYSNREYIHSVFCYVLTALQHHTMPVNRPCVAMAPRVSLLLSTNMPCPVRMVANNPPCPTPTRISFYTSSLSSVTAQTFSTSKKTPVSK
jgi:hypothetical protein